ncbi:MAG: ATP-binding protein [Candidatus Marsarchaeota archaeon]|jgi:PAS domain S-box-containing protein|nr:ATP-binding protein [Candidatus Marsarchaeota archaeon]
MAENIVLEKFMYDLLPLAMSQYGEKETVEGFAKSVKEVFGIDAANLKKTEALGEENGGIYGYVANTKKVYIDNQLSEYSEFPQLINYRNLGYSSCAILPLMVGGRIIGVLELLSKMENRFSKEMLNSLSIGAAFIGLTISYASEAMRSRNLAAYFDSAFGNATPNMLISQSGKVIKANKKAMALFRISQSNSPEAKQIIGIDFKELRGMQPDVPVKKLIKVSGELRSFEIHASSINSSTVYVSLVDTSDRELIEGVSDGINNTGKIVALSLDGEFRVIGGFGRLGKWDNIESLDIRNFKLGDLMPTSDYSALQSALKSRGKVLVSTEVSIGGYKEKVYMSLSKTAFGYLCLMLSAELEESVKMLSSNLKDFIDVTSDITLIVDQNGTITDANLPAEQLLGYKKEQLLGKDIRTIYSEEDTLDRDIAYVKSGGKVDGSYVELKKSNSEMLPGTHSLRLFFDGESYFYAIMIKELQTKRTINDMEMLNRKLEGQAKNFRMASELKSQFIYNISHELKTPLTNIKGFAKLLHEGEFGQLNADQKEYMDTILDESDRLMLIITQVLDAAKLEANKVKLDLKEVNLSELANNPSIKALEENAKNKGLAFAWNVDYDVPAITADPNRLIQVFVNLIGNSLKFTESGKITVHISKFSKRSVMCEVIDTGIGISDDDKKKIFKKFYQASKKGLVKPDGTGTGLGLAITKEIVDLHRGRIKFDSTLGKGSRFYFTMPISQSSTARQRRRE